MKRSIWCLIAIVALAEPLACYRYARQPTFRSNFADVRLTTPRIVTAATGAPYSGTLVARDREIAAVARRVLSEVWTKGLDAEELGGLILVLPVDNGTPSGRATVYVDLRAPKLPPELTRRADAGAVELARAIAPTIAVATATFKDGKLDGTASVLVPSGGGTRTSKVAEAEFRGGVLHGTATEYFPGTDRPQRTMGFERGTRSGLQRSFHRNGKLARESAYRDGELEGEVIEYYANGAVRARSTYVRGEPAGTTVAWFPTGARQREVVFDDAGPRMTEWYSNGEVKLRAGPDGEIRFPPDGVIEEYHASGARRSRARYAHGVQHGPFEVYYADGRAWKVGTFEGGKQTGTYRAWWKNGRPAEECQYAHGERDGSCKRWYANGTLWESVHYAAGKPTGPYRKWWKNGAPAHVYAYRDGKLDGDYRTFYDSGAKWAVGSYVNGKPQGAMQRWFPDGKLGYILQHKNGRPDGEFKRWYADGKPRLEATYVSGQLDGEFKNWLDNGSVYELATYQRGVRLRTTRASAQR